LSTFSHADRVDELIDLLPRVLPVMNSDKGTASAFQCLGKHGRHEAALSCLTLLKKSGKLSHELSYTAFFVFLHLTLRVIKTFVCIMVVCCWCLRVETCLGSEIFRRKSRTVESRFCRLYSGFRKSQQGKHSYAWFCSMPVLQFD
jgi:hypothetical protein